MMPKKEERQLSPETGPFVDQVGNIANAFDPMKQRSICSSWTKVFFRCRRSLANFMATGGEFYDQEQYKGRAIFVRYLWQNISPKSARMEQSFSADGEKIWETNWICELGR